jgi:YgiT-type zinc finger domain-containing protein
MKHKYDDCLFCGGVVEERLLPREIRWKGELLVFEDVPVGVCVQCGEKFLRPAVAKKIDAALQSKKRPNLTLQVPVYQYQMDVA